MSCHNVRIIHGVPDSLQESAFQLYLHEFKKNHDGFPLTEEKLIKLLTLSLDWQFTLAAVDGERVIGLAGYQLGKKAFTGAANPFQLVMCLGVRDFWRLSRSCIGQYRKAEPLELLHDGLMVSSDYRRRGIATRLLNALSHYAKSKDFQRMRLDVVPHNAAAISLYKCIGYQSCEKNTSGAWVYRRYLDALDT